VTCDKDHGKADLTFREGALKLDTAYPRQTHIGHDTPRTNAIVLGEKLTGAGKSPSAQPCGFDDRPQRR
jgi:hypothetical protein